MPRCHKLNVFNSDSCVSGLIVTRKPTPLFREYNSEKMRRNRRNEATGNLESRNNNTWNSEKEGGNKRRTKQKVEMTWTIAKSDKKASLIGKKTCVGQLWER